MLERNQQLLLERELNRKAMLNDTIAGWISQRKEIYTDKCLQGKMKAG